MPNRLPNVSNKHKICIICEGNEEYKYLERLKQLGVWNESYEVFPINAEGNGNIPARYQDRYQNGEYEVVLVFCDTEKKPYEQYDDIKRKINEFHGVNNIADEIVIFGNPCTMQIISKHWADEIIKKPLKSENAPLIEKYTGVSKYKAKENQIDQVMRSINKENYNDMKNRISNMSQDDHLDGSSNFIKLINRLETNDVQWIAQLNNEIEGI